MAKDKQTQDVNVVQVVKTPNIVTMQDGSVKNFGERGRLLSTSVIGEDSFSTTFHIVNGAQISYQFTGSIALLLEMAAFGFDAKVKASCAGVSVDGIEKVITDKVTEITAGNFVGRSTGELTSSLSQIQTAYAIVNDIDVSTSEGIAKVNAIFSAMSKEDKAGLYKVAKIQLELAKLKLAAAKAALELEEKVTTV
jgi:hypothetical protein